MSGVIASYPNLPCPPSTTRRTLPNMLRRALLALLALTLLASAQQTPTRPAITGIAFARFSTTSPAAAQRFYSQTLGYTRHTISGPLWIYPVNPSQWIEIDPSAAPPAPNLRMLAVGFTTRDAAALQTYLQAHQIPINQPLKDGQFAVRDPEGNLVYFVQSAASAASSTAALVAAAPPSPTAPSHRLIHAGYIVEDPAKESAFWQNLLGFRPLWHGGYTPDRTEWMSFQVPDGTDWIEYMLNTSPSSDLRTHGGADHISLGTPDMQTVLTRLARNHCQGPDCTASKLGLDGKTQLNLHDPDLTRIEFMEFTPRQTPCCSPITGATPTEIESR